MKETTEKRLYLKGTPIERAINRIVLDENGCWLWDGALHNGYGWMTIKWGVQSFSYRVTYTHFRGEVPSGLELDHLCRVRSCCNPWHLEAVAQ